MVCGGPTLRLPCMPSVSTAHPCATRNCSSIQPRIMASQSKHSAAVGRLEPVLCSFQNMAAESAVTACARTSNTISDRWAAFIDQCWDVLVAFLGKLHKDLLTTDVLMIG